MKKIIANVVVAMLAAIVCIVPNASVSEAAAYTYTSEKYAYSIDCPQKPVGILDLANQSKDKKGEILIFENQGMDITYDWIVMTDAFNDESLPDLTKLTKEQVDELLKEMVKTNGMAVIVPVEGQAAIYTIALSEDRATTYIRGKNGQKYAVVVDAPKDVFKTKLTDYQNGLLSFKTK